MRHLVAVSLVLACALSACRKAPPASTAEDAPLPAIDETALDRSVAPCDDFFQFACGTWLAKTEIPADRPYWHRGFMSLEERNQRLLRRILEGAAERRVEPDVRFAGKLGDYWASCMDEAAVEARGLAELHAEWARIDAIRDRPALAAELARAHVTGSAAPFGMFADQDAKNSTEVILTVYQAGLSLPDREYYLSSDPKNAEIRAAYGQHLRRMLTLAGVSQPDADAQASAVEGLERALAESHYTQVEMRDPARVYNRVDRGGLEKLAPAFPWASFFEGLGHTGLTAVNVSTPRFVETVGRLFESAPIDAWRAYLRWEVLSAMADARALPRRFVDERFAFTSKSFTGTAELPPRWKFCVDATDEALGFALGELYVRRHFGPEGKERTTRLVAEIEEAMDRDLARLEWMDDPTRSQAKEKLRKVFNKVGYPETWRDYSTMKVGRESYFRNVLAGRRFEVNRQLDKVGKPLDRGEWFMSPPTVNAYYNPAMNEMVFPAGILQPPFFNKDAPETVNYGAIGMVVGHELTHGFDDSGRQYDALGNLRDWWTPTVSKEFVTRAQCIVKQYAAYESLPGVKLNGELTLGENIADLGGLRLAFAAMQHAREGKGDAAAEKVAGFTPEQQFFVGYAQSWCAKYREQELRRRAVVDPHSPAKFRVNGPLANMREFATAFRCADGTPMVRTGGERCEIW